MWSTELSECVAYNPMSALSRAHMSTDIVDGLVPDGGVTWLYGPSGSFKSFVVLSMAAAVAAGEPWLGRATEESVVVYIGAEGGDALHVRRAAAEMPYGRGLPIVVVQERPTLDKAQGVLHMQAVLNAVAETYWGEPLWPDIRESVLAQDAECAAADTEHAAALSRWQACKANRASADMTGEAKDALLAARDRRHAARERVEADTLALYDGVYAKYAVQTLALKTPPRRILCVIDTYAQTASDDSRAAVSAYVKNLRALGVTCLVVDHATKEGGSYLGSVAKLNDVDSQIELTRPRGGMAATLHVRKAKNGPVGKPLEVALRPYVFEGFADAAGRPLETLVASEAVGLPEGHAGALLSLLAASGGVMPKRDLKKAFMATQVGVQQASAEKAFLRASRALLAGGLTSETDGTLRTDISTRTTPP